MPPHCNVAAGFAAENVPVGDQCRPYYDIYEAFLFCAREAFLFCARDEDVTVVAGSEVASVVGGSADEVHIYILSWRTLL